MLEAGDAIIASIASAPLDKVNESEGKISNQFTVCLLVDFVRLLNQHSFTIVECTEVSDDVPSDSTCIPILGSLKVGYYGNTYSEQEISYSVLNFIERGSNEAWFTNSVINKVVYAGKKSEIFCSFCDLQHGRRIKRTR